MKAGFGKNFIVTILAVLLFQSRSFAFDHFNAGKKAFYLKNYASARVYFEYALKNNPNNINCMYYHAQTLVYLYRLKDAQREYERIIELSPSSDAAKLSSVGIAKIQQYILDQNKFDLNSSNLKLSSKDKLKKELLNGVEDNYIDNASDNGMVVRWNISKLPLKVYFKPANGVPGFQPGFVDAVKDALKVWLPNIDPHSTIKTVSDPKTANFVVLFMPVIADASSKEASGGFVSGLSTPHSEKGILKFADIKFATLKPNKQPCQRVEIFNTALHELGHALGIMGHSPDKDDIMYAVVDDSKKQQYLSLSQRDINTIKLLYRLDADISNFDNDKIPQKKSDKNLAILGDKSFMLDKKVKEALDYTQQVPNHPISWTSLGSAYYDTKDYQNAITSYKKALTIDSKYKQALEGLAKTYTQTGDFTNSIMTYQALVNLNPTSTAYYYNAAYLYYKANQLSEAQSILDALFIRNPKAKEDGNIQALEKVIRR